MVDINTMKDTLLKEKSTLEAELAEISTRDTQNTEDWHATAGEVQTGTADAQVLADRFEESLTNEGIVSQLEIRHKEILAALERIENNTYGVCAVGGEAIPEERLHANPAAATCVEHSA